MQESARIRSRNNLLRCPFCHENVRLESEWVVCRSCLARHHQGCWSESGACAACGDGSQIGGIAERPRGEALRLLRVLDADAVEEPAFADYLLSYLSLGLWAVVASELRLIAHVRQNERELPGLEDVGTGELGVRRRRYRYQTLGQTASSARLRLGTVLLAAIVCVVLGLLSLELGLVFSLPAWAGTLVAACGAHWAAVRRHESRQLYLRLLDGALTPGAAAVQIRHQHQRWDLERGKGALSLAVVSVLMPPLVPWLAVRAFSAPLNMHQEKEDSWLRAEDEGDL